MNWNWWLIIALLMGAASIGFVSKDGKGKRYYGKAFICLLLALVLFAIAKNGGL